MGTFTDILGENPYGKEDSYLKMEIDFALINEVADFKEDYNEIYQEIIKETAKQLEIESDLELSCIFVDDNKIHEINKQVTVPPDFNNTCSTFVGILHLYPLM